MKLGEMDSRLIVGLADIGVVSYENGLFSQIFEWQRHIGGLVSGGAAGGVGSVWSGCETTGEAG